MSIARPLPLLLTLLLAPVLTGAQIVRDPTATSPSGGDRGSPSGAGRRAQAQFEQFRREHLPNAARGRPGRCDEQVGRFCYWYDEKEPAAPKEPKAITDARDKLVATLDSLTRVAPDDPWLAAERVRYLAESERFGDALKAAHECQVGGWWCDILTGFSLHLLGEYAAADSTYDSALTMMLPRDQCMWRDISMLLDEDARQQYHRTSCGTPERRAFEDRVWFLARTRYAMPGNDSRSEWFARMTMTLMLRDAPSTYQFGFDDDERELLLRFGWPRAWAKTWSQGGTSFIGHEPSPAYRYIPAGFVLNNPPVSDSAEWRLQLPPVVGRYAPPYARSLLPLEHQKAMFRRGDSALVVLAYDVRGAPEMAGAPVEAAVTLTTATAPHGAVTILHDAPRTAVLTVRAPWEPLLMSAEVEASSKQALRRARYGVQPPYAVGTRVTLSDLLFYKTYGSIPQTVEEAAPHAYPTERLRGDEKLGVYWEAYGTDPQGETMTISLTVMAEVKESGFFRRRAESLKLTREATPVSVTVKDRSARGAGISPRALELDMSRLKKGSYVVQLEIDVAGQYVVHADHRIEIIGP